MTIYLKTSLYTVINYSKAYGIISYNYINYKFNSRSS